MNTLDRLYISGKVKMAKFIDGFKKDESGVSSIVATVLLILIVVLLAAIFWENISTWFTETWEKITGKAATIG